MLQWADPLQASQIEHSYTCSFGPLGRGAMKARLRVREEYEAMRKECGSKVRPEVAEAHHAAVYNKWEEHSAKREHTNLNQGSKERQIKELKYKLEREGKDISNFKFEEKVTFMQYKEQMFGDYQRMRRQVGLPESHTSHQRKIWNSKEKCDPRGRKEGNMKRKCSQRKRQCKRIFNF